MATPTWFAVALSAAAFVLALRQDLLGEHPRGSLLPLERLNAADERAREDRANARINDAYWRAVGRDYSALLDSLYDHRRANPGRLFDGLELGSFPSDEVLDRANTYVRPGLDDHGQLVVLYVDALRTGTLPPVCHDDECGEPTCTLERRLVAVWGEPDQRIGANDCAVWIDPALRLRATFSWPCALWFERY